MNPATATRAKRPSGAAMVVDWVNLAVINSAGMVCPVPAATGVAVGSYTPAALPPKPRTSDRAEGARPTCFDTDTPKNQGGAVEYTEIGAAVAFETDQPGIETGAAFGTFQLKTNTGAGRRDTAPGESIGGAGAATRPIEPAAAAPLRVPFSLAGGIREARPEPLTDQPESPKGGHRGGGVWEDPWPGQNARTALGQAKTLHVREFCRLAADIGFNRALREYVTGVLDGAIPFPTDLAKAMRKPLTMPALKNWAGIYKAKGPLALDLQYRGNPQGGHFAKNPGQKEFALSLLMNHPEIRAARIHELLGDRFGAEAVPVYSTVAHWKQKHVATHAAEIELLSNPDKWKSKRRVAFGSYSENITRLNQLWEIDSTTLEVMFAGDTRRRALIQATDVFSGRRLFRLAPVSNSAEIGALLLEAVRKWGLPEAIKSDNGKDYTSAALERFFRDLGIKHVLCAPYSPQQKPHVERGFGDFVRDIVELIPGYLGHNVAQAQAIRARRAFGDRGAAFETAVTVEQFEAWLEAWMDRDYHRKRSEYWRLKGKSPADMVNEWAASNKINMVQSPETLGFLLSVPKTRTVQKKGITLNKRWFICPEMGLDIGQKVEVRESAESQGHLAVFDTRGEFLYIAVCPELEGVSRAEITARAAARQKAAVAATRAVARELKKLTKPTATIDSLLESRQTSNVAAFQRPEYQETSATIALAAADAALGLAAKAAKEQTQAIEARAARYSDDDLEAMRGEIEAMEQAAAAKAAASERADTRFARLYRELEYGGALEPTDAEFFERYRDTDDGRFLARLLATGAAV